MKEYSFTKGLKKGAIGLVVFGLPFLITNFPDIASLSLGTVALILVNYIKVRFM